MTELDKNTDGEPDLEALVRAAEAGDGLAACRLGSRYREGDGVLLNPRRAFRWYVRSALAGYAAGMNNLAVCYERGFGCRPDERKAAHWYRRSCERGCEMAMVNLAHCYRLGRGVERDVDLAFRLYKAALELGIEDAREWVESVKFQVPHPKPVPGGIPVIDETLEYLGRGISILGTGLGHPKKKNPPDSPEASG